MPSRTTFLLVAFVFPVLLGIGLLPKASAFITETATVLVTDYTADGRMPQEALFDKIEMALSTDWQAETVYVYPSHDDLKIRAWRTRHNGPALWILSGLHGEEPAGPNAIARQAPLIDRIAGSGVPVVLIPLANPRGYRNNWRYPNTAERDWKAGGGYSVGDSEYLLPDLETGSRPRTASVSGPETLALTSYAHTLASAYPPALVLDLHEDELSVEGGYIYSQGKQADQNPIGAEVIRALQSAGIKLRMDGITRFGEPIAQGVISRDDKGLPIRDGSIDELLASDTVFIDGVNRNGPGARTVIVVETPADRSISFEQRVAGHGEVLKRLEILWQLNQAIPD
jgi:hypothetical protein